MTIEIKYYKYTDPQTGIVLKDIGYTHTRTLTKSKTLIKDGKREVLSSEDFEKVSEVSPVQEGYQEITKEEFESLPVKDENSPHTKAVERKLLAIGQLIERFEKIKSPNAQNVKGKIIASQFRRIERLKKLNK